MASERRVIREDPGNRGARSACLGEDAGEVDWERYGLRRIEPEAEGDRHMASRLRLKSGRVRELCAALSAGGHRQNGAID